MLYNQAKQRTAVQHKKIHLHGTIGAGKPHLLAVLVCLLAKEGFRVVYIPDCYELLMAESPSAYLVKAFYTLLKNDLILGERIAALAHGLLKTTYEASQLEGELVRLCDAAAEISRTMCFVVNQANVLDEVMETESAMRRNRLCANYWMASPLGISKSLVLPQTMAPQSTMSSGRQLKKDYVLTWD